MTIRRFLPALLLATVLALPAAAAADLPSPLTLDDALARAETASPSIRQADASADAAAEEARAARGARWGHLDLVGTAARLNDDAILRPMSRQLFEEAGSLGLHGLPLDRNQRHWGAELEVPLWTGGTLSRRIRAADLGKVRARALAEGSRWQVRANVASLYGAVVSLDALAEALGRYGEALGATRRKLELMVREGKRPRVDLLKVEDEAAAVEGRRAEVRAHRARAAALLAALLGLEPGELPDLVPPGERETGALLALELPPRDELVDRALASSRTRAARAEAGRARELERAARGELLPKVVAKGTWIRNEAPSLSEPLDTWQVALAVKVPVFAGGSRWAKHRAARHRAEAARAGEERTRLEVIARVDEARSSVEAAGARVRAARARREAAEEAARIERLRYENGAGTIEDLLRAEARAAEARAAVVAARADLRTAVEALSAACETEFFPGAGAPETE